MIVAPWMTPDEEARSVRLAAARAGCVVKDARVADTLAGPRAICRVSCPNGWAAATMLLSLCVEDAKTAGARDVALAMRRDAPSDAAFAAFVHRYVIDNVAFVREQGEVFAGPSYTLVAQGGDCDDHVRLTFALLAAGGLPVRLAFLYHAREVSLGPSHVVVQVMIGGAWTWVETTIAAAFGENPLDAATRTGVARNRSDLATEVRFMNEKDLPPLPPDFVLRNPDVALDVASLASLGYLVGRPHLSAGAGAFRLAVARFQKDHPPLVVDGEIGPKTRAALAHAISAMGPSIGSLGVVAVTAKTAYLSDGFFADLLQMEKDFRARGAKVSGEDFMATWSSESGVNPARRGNKGPKGERYDLEFGGLNMMDSGARRGVGFTGTLDEWLELPDREQLAFVRKFYERDVAAFCGGKFACLADVGSLYLMNFLPKYMPHANEPTFVLAAKNGPNGDGDPRSAAWFDANAGISRDKETIRVGDLPPFAMRGVNSDPAKWKELQARYRSVGGSPMSPPSAPGSSGVLVAGVLALGAIAAAWRFLG